ncbi:hypothetical protein D3C77_637050 [compost metagenome]
MDRVIGCFQPNFMSAAVDSLEAIRHVLAKVECLPEGCILGRGGLFSRAEQTMVFTNNLG